VFVVVDRLTKMTHFVPCHKLPSAEETARLLLQNVVRLHGVPESTVSDRGSQFVGQFWQSLARLVDFRVNLSTAYHPQTDGQTERMNRVLGDVLRTFCDLNPSRWDEALPLAEFAANNAKNRSTGQTLSL